MFFKVTVQIIIQMTHQVPLMHDLKTSRPHLSLFQSPRQWSFLCRCDGFQAGVATPGSALGLLHCFPPPALGLPCWHSRTPAWHPRESVLRKGRGVNIPWGECLTSWKRESGAASPSSHPLPGQTVLRCQLRDCLEDGPQHWAAEHTEEQQV